MKFRLAAGLCLCVVLAGCSSLPSFGDLLNFSGSNDDDMDSAPAQTVAAAAPPAAPAAAGQPDPFCVSVAAQDAQQGGFDQATQQRMIQRGYQQCVTMYHSP